VQSLLVRKKAAEADFSTMCPQCEPAATALTHDLRPVAIDFKTLRAADTNCLHLGRVACNRQPFVVARVSFGPPPCEQQRSELDTGERQNEPRAERRECDCNGEGDKNDKSVSANPAG